jgi:hypothetical protein
MIYRDLCGRFYERGVTSSGLYYDECYYSNAGDVETRDKLTEEEWRILNDKIKTQRGLWNHSGFGLDSL